jgi:hypothetical protein
MFGSVVTVVFQSVFRSKIHQNYFLKKIIFDIYTLKRLKNIEKKIKKKKSNFWETRNAVSTTFPNAH